MKETKVTFCGKCGFVVMQGVAPGSCTFKHNDYFLNIGEAFVNE